MSNSKEDARAYLHSIAREHLASNVRSYKYQVYNGEGNNSNMLGFQVDIKPQEGKVVATNNDWVVLKTARTEFFLASASLLDNLPNLNDIISITPYARKRFDGRRLDAPEREEVSGGMFIRTITIGDDVSRLPVDKKSIKCPELLEMINQVEKLRAPDGQRTIVQMLVDNGAGPNLKIVDPKPSKIFETPPSLTFGISNNNMTGEVVISYERGLDYYAVKTLDQNGKMIKEVENIDFTSLAERVHDLVDDGSWKIAKTEVIKAAPRKRAVSP